MVITIATGVAVLGLYCLACYLYYLRKLGERVSKVETLAGAKELEILQKQLDQPKSKPNFGGDEEDDIANTIMKND